MSFNLTRKTDYALVALAKLAQEKMNAGGEPVSARTLADQYHLPLPLLMNALKELHRGGILDSRRGTHGGYYLTRDPEKISLREVIEALEGTVNVTLCSDENHQADQGVCNLVDTCIISEPIRRFNWMLNDFLDRISLKDLVTQEFGDAKSTPASLTNGVRV